MRWTASHTALKISPIISKLKRIGTLILMTFIICGAFVLSAGPASAAPGDLDTTFGTGGFITTNVGSGTDQGRGVVLQSDGKIVVAGQANNGVNDDIMVIRYNSDGSVDTGFGTSGMVMTAMGTMDVGRDVALQSDGRIVVVGITDVSGNDDFAVARYNTDGTPDTTFGISGEVFTQIGSTHDAGQAVVIQPDGKIVVGGWTNNGANDDFVVVRYNTDGSLDTSFGTGGFAITPFGSGSEAVQALALQSDGKIVAFGYTYNGTDFDFAVARYNTDGSLDTSFGSGGRVTTAIGSGDDMGMAVAIQTDGRIVAAGSSHNGANFDAALVRYNTDGSLDTTFGTGGRVTTTVGSGNEQANGVYVQSDGKIAAFGQGQIGGQDDIVAIRYNSDGTLDTSFASNGIATTAVGVGNDWGYCGLIQPDGNILVVGSADVVGGIDTALVRYQGDPLIALTVQKSGTGTGRITSSPIGIDCGSDCREGYASGSQVTLTGEPDSGSALDSWSVAGCSGNYDCTVTMDSTLTVTVSFNPDTDEDGVSDNMENGGPNGGDGDGNGVPDSQESNVATLKNTKDQYVTLVAPTGTKFKNVTARETPDGPPANISFPTGMYGFEIKNIAAGASVEATLILHNQDSSLIHYYKYGPTSADQSDHWYPFMDNGTTGATISHTGSQTRITLKYVDGERGDSDLTADGIIIDPSGPGNEGGGGGIGGGGGGGGGCFISQSAVN